MWWLISHMGHFLNALLVLEYFCTTVHCVGADVSIWDIEEWGHTCIQVISRILLWSCMQGYDQVSYQVSRVLIKMYILKNIRFDTDLPPVLRKQQEEATNNFWNPVWSNIGNMFNCVLLQWVQWSLDTFHQLKLQINKWSQTLTAAC